MKSGTFQRVSGFIVIAGGSGLMVLFLIIGILNDNNLEGTVLEKFMPLLGLAFAIGLLALW